MELGVSHVQSLSSLTPIVDNIFDKYNNKNLVPIRSLSDHDICEECSFFSNFETPLSKLVMSHKWRFQLKRKWIFGGDYLNFGPINGASLVNKSPLQFACLYILG